MYTKLIKNCSFEKNCAKIGTYRSKMGTNRSKIGTAPPKIFIFMNET